MKIDDLHVFSVISRGGWSIAISILNLMSPLVFRYIDKHVQVSWNLLVIHWVLKGYEHIRFATRRLQS